MISNTRTYNQETANIKVKVQQHFSTSVLKLLNYKITLFPVQATRQFMEKNEVASIIESHPNASFFCFLACRSTY